MEQMRKPRWYINFRLNKLYSISNFLPSYYFVKKLCWKDKYDTPRVEILPKLLFYWAWFELSFVRGTDQEWEWWLWVNKYHNNDIDEAMATWPWGKNTINGFVQTKPWETYRKTKISNKRVIKETHDLDFHC